MWEEGVSRPQCVRKKRTAAGELCAAQKWRKEGGAGSYSKGEMRCGSRGEGAAPGVRGAHKRPAALQVQREVK
jgi:hypothetical protein